MAAFTIFALLELHLETEILLTFLLVQVKHMSGNFFARSTSIHL